MLFQFSHDLDKLHCIYDCCLCDKGYFFFFFFFYINPVRKFCKNWKSISIYVLAFEFEFYLYLFLECGASWACSIQWELSISFAAECGWIQSTWQIVVVLYATWGYLNAIWESNPLCKLGFRVESNSTESLFYRDITGITEMRHLVLWALLICAPICVISTKSNSKVRKLTGEVG